MSMTDAAEVAVFNFQVRQLFDVFDFGRRIGVVQNALNAAKAFRAHHFFAIEIAVRPAELRVALVWNIAEFMIEGHVSSPCGLVLIDPDYSTSFELRD